MSDRSWLRYWKVHGCVTGTFWLALLGLAVYGAGKVYRLW